MVTTRAGAKKPKFVPRILTNFALTKLPQEVQATIIELACRLPRPSSLDDDEETEGSGRGPAWLYVAHLFAPKPTVVDLDVPTTLSLALVSREVSSQVATILYGHVRLAQPSALRSLHQTLASKPELGRHIRSLSVGPKGKLDAGWPSLLGFSRNQGPTVTCLSSSLSWLREDHLIPVWVKGLHFPVHAQLSSPDCRGVALFKALASAQNTFDVDVSKQPYSRKGALIDEVSELYR